MLQVALNDVDPEGMISFSPPTDDPISNETFVLQVDRNEPIELGLVGTIIGEDGLVLLPIGDRNSTLARLFQEMKHGESIRVSIRNPSGSEYRLPLSGFARAWSRLEPLWQSRR